MIPTDIASNCIQRRLREEPSQQLDELADPAPEIQEECDRVDEHGEVLLGQAITAQSRSTAAGARRYGARTFSGEACFGW